MRKRWAVPLTVAAGLTCSPALADGPVPAWAKKPPPHTPCTSTSLPVDICRVELSCGQIATCGEAHYRLKVCGHWKLDGGLYPAEGQPNGVPCEQQLCGRTLSIMNARIAAQPFSPPEQRVCK